MMQAEQVDAEHQQQYDDQGMEGDEEMVSDSRYHTSLAAVCLVPVRT